VDNPLALVDICTPFAALGACDAVVAAAARRLNPNLAATKLSSKKRPRALLLWSLRQSLPPTACMTDRDTKGAAGAMLCSLVRLSCWGGLERSAAQGGSRDQLLQKFLRPGYSLSTSTASIFSLSSCDVSAKHRRWDLVNFEQGSGLKRCQELDEARRHQYPLECERACAPRRANPTCLYKPQVMDLRLVHTRSVATLKARHSLCLTKVLLLRQPKPHV